MTFEQIHSLYPWVLELIEFVIDSVRAGSPPESVLAMAALRADANRPAPGHRAAILAKLDQVADLLREEQPRPQPPPAPPAPCPHCGSIDALTGRCWCRGGQPAHEKSA